MNSGHSRRTLEIEAMKDRILIAAQKLYDEVGYEKFLKKLEKNYEPNGTHWKYNQILGVALVETNKTGGNEFFVVFTKHPRSIHITTVSA